MKLLYIFKVLMDFFFACTTYRLLYIRLSTCRPTQYTRFALYVIKPVLMNHILVVMSK